MQATLKRFTMLFVALTAFAAALLFIPTLKAEAFTQSVTIGVDQVKSLTDNQYSEGTKQWTISDETILELVTQQSSSTIVVKGLKTGSTSVICKTYYTEWTTKYDSSLGIWVPTTQQGMVYSTFNVTVSETASNDTEITFSDAMLEADTDEDGNLTLVSGARRVLLTSTLSESLEWTSSDANVVDVDKMGCIVAVKPGTATITINDPVYGSASKTITVITPEQAGYTPISTLDELKAISGVAGNYYLTNDIDFGGTSALIKLDGKFDGQGHTITGFVSNRALFYANGNPVSIENLTMKDCSVVSDGSAAMLLDISSTSSANYIINCHVVGGSVSTDCDAAGLVCSYACTGDCTLGHSVKNNILLCTNSASVQGKQRVGGITSFNHGQIIFCENSGDISIKSGTKDTKGYCSAGGILGSDYMHWTGTTANRTYYASTRIMYCTNKGQISGLVVGGIAGTSYGTNIVRSTNYGTVKTDTTVKPYSSASGYGAYSLIGGITGRMSYGYGSAFSMIMYCANKGSVLADDSSGTKFCSGGIVGYAYLNGNFGNIGTPIHHCFTTKGGSYNNKYSGYSYTGGIIAALSGSQYTNYVATYSYAQDSTIVGTSSGTGCSYLYSDNMSYASKADIMTITSSKLYNPNNDWTAVEDDYPVLTMEVNSEYGSKILNRITYDTAGCTYADGEYIKAYYSDGTSYKLPKLSTPCGFDGWYTDSDFKNKIEFISPDVTGDLNLYAKVNHTYSNSVVAPTYTKQGYTLFICTKCDYSYKTNYTDKLKLSAVTGLTLTPTSSTSVTLSWDKNDGATGYFIQQYKNGEWTHIRQLARNTVLSYTATGLLPFTNYNFRIRAYYTSDDTTVYSDYTTVSGTTKSSNMTGVTATSTANTVTLSWNKNDAATGYLIQQYKNGEWTHIRQLARNTATTFTASGLTPSTKYQFRIRAYYTSGDTTVYSDYKYVSPTTRPSNLTGVKATSTANTVTLSWDKNDTATGYFIQQYKDGKWTHIRQLARNTVLSYTATGLTPSTTYQYRIRAYYTNGTSTTYSDYKYVSPTTRPSNMTGVKVTSTSNTVTLSWNKNDTATGYFIQQYKNGEWTHIRQLARNTVLSYTATGLDSSTTYQFRIRAYYTNGSTTTNSDYVTVSVKTTI